MPRKPNPDTVASAYHEAGHVAYAFHTGLSLRAATIRPTTTTAAHTEFLGPPNPDGDAAVAVASMEGKIVATFAGPLAEMLQVGMTRADHLNREHRAADTPPRRLSERGQG